MRAKIELLDFVRGAGKRKESTYLKSYYKHITRGYRIYIYLSCIYTSIYTMYVYVVLSNILLIFINDIFNL